MDGDVDSFFLPGGILDNDEDGGALFISHSVSSSQTRRLYSIDSDDHGNEVVEGSDLLASRRGGDSYLAGDDLPGSPRTALYSMSGTNPMAKEFHPPPQDTSAFTETAGLASQAPAFPSWIPEEPAHSAHSNYARSSNGPLYDAPLVGFSPTKTSVTTHAMTTAEPIHSAYLTHSSLDDAQFPRANAWGTGARATLASPVPRAGNAVPSGLTPVVDSRSAPPLGHARPRGNSMILTFNGTDLPDLTRARPAEQLRTLQQLPTSGKPPSGPRQAGAASSTAWSTTASPGSTLEPSRNSSKVVMLGAKCTEDASSGAHSTNTGGAATLSDGRGRKVSSKAADGARPGEWLTASAGRGRSPGGGRTAQERRHQLRGPRFTSGVGPARKTTAESWGSEDPSLASSSSSSSESEKEDESGPSRLQPGLVSAGSTNVMNQSSGRERGKKESKAKKGKSGVQQQEQLRDRRASKEDRHFKALPRSDRKTHDHQRSHIHSSGALLAAAAAAAAPTGSVASEASSVAAPGVGLVALPLPHLPTSLPDLRVPRAAMGHTAGAARRAAGAAAREGAHASRQAAGAARRRLGGLSGRLRRQGSKLLWSTWRLHVSCGKVLCQSWPVTACMALPFAVRCADWVGEAPWAPHWAAPCLVYGYLAQLLEPPTSSDDRINSHETRSRPTVVSSQFRASSSSAALAAALTLSKATTVPASHENVTAPAARVTSSTNVHSSRRSSSGNTASGSHEGANRGRNNSSSSSNSSSISDRSAGVEKLASNAASSWSSLAYLRVRRFTPRILLSLALLSEGFTDRSVLLDLRNGHLLLLAFLLAASKKTPKCLPNFFFTVYLFDLLHAFLHA